MTAANASHAGTGEPRRGGRDAVTTSPAALISTSATSGRTDGDASIDGDDDAGHVGAGTGREVDRDARHVLGLADATERTRGNDRVAEAIERRGHHLAL